MSLIAVSVFLLGLIIGSFLNVVVLRMGTSSLGGRSACESCATTLRWYELVPVMSFLALRGRCRTCAARISWQYPIVELGTGALFLLAFFVAGPTAKAVVDCVAFAALVVIFAYDARHKIIPSIPLLTFVVAALASSYLATGETAYFLVSAMSLFFPFYLLWRLSDGRWIGLGDADLAFGIGAMLGVALGLSAIVVGFWAGALYGIVRLGQRAMGATIDNEVPFAPFLIAGLILVYATGIDVIGLSDLLYR
jgi:prepilin signal peptidase PulO-like enzyme (type II secretory pathway)